MDLIFEFIAELLLEGGLEIGTNKKISKWIRYPILIIILAFVGGIIALLFILGITLLKTNILAALLLITVTLILLIGSIYKFKKILQEKSKREN